MELKKCWIVRSPSKEYRDDYATPEDFIHECETINNLVNVIIGTPHGVWDREKTAIHTDASSAMADAKKRLDRWKPKTASRVAERFIKS